MEKLKNASFGKITEFGEEERRFYKTFAQFITGRGFEVDETQYVNEATQESSRFRIETRNPVSINATKIPIIYLDDAFLVDFDILYQFSMEQVDYVIVNKSGIGEGVRGGAGVIRIYTDPFKKFQQPKKISFTEYTIPLTYSTPKRFYIPEYSSYNSNFFKEFGVIDWMPNAKFDANGNLSFKVFDTNTNITLFIEGVVNGNQLISQEITINN